MMPSQILPNPCLSVSIRGSTCSSVSIRGGSLFRGLFPGHATQLPPQRVDLLFDGPVLGLLQRQEGAGDAQLLGKTRRGGRVAAPSGRYREWRQVGIGRAGYRSLIKLCECSFKS